MEETLIELMKKTLADTFAMYLKAHNYHWNVEGPNFPQYHGFLGDLYEELHGAVDPIAEHIRALNAYAPGSFARFKELTDIEDELSIPMASQMMGNLYRDNQTVLDTLNMTFKIATQAGKDGVADFIASRIDVHEKHGWMLRSIIK